MALLALLPADALEAALAAGRQGHFLDAHELTTLRALTDRFVPGPQGAVAGRTAEAIDLLLGAFRGAPGTRGRVHAGGPFSGRHGGRRDDFARFVGLDAQAALGWRIRIEGSRGRRSREFGGPVRGYQQIYREGLKHLDARAGGNGFASAPQAAQTAILSDQADAAVQELVSTALSHTVEFLYGPPEYGGNHGLVGWKSMGWDGDVQPRGYSAARVSKADPR